MTAKKCRYILVKIVDEGEKVVDIYTYIDVCVHILVVDIMVDFVHKHYLKYHGFLE